MKFPSKMLQNLEYVDIDIQQGKRNLAQNGKRKKTPNYGITYFNYKGNFEAFHQAQISYF